MVDGFSVRDWEECWRRGETPWDKGEAAPPLLEYLASRDDGFVSGARVLVPGCGSGHDVRALAAAGARPTGLDLSGTAIEVARSHARVGGEVYLQGCFFEWAEGGFDAIWEHTCFCAIDPAERPRYARAAARALRPGGRLIGVFYLNPDHDDEGPPHRAEREEIRGHLGPWFSLLDAKVPELAFPSRAGREWLAVFERLASPDPASPDRGVADRPRGS